MYEEYTRDAVIKLVQRGFESLKVDYKQTLDLSNPKHREELIKDVSAMANTVVPDDSLARIGLNPKAGFILIGVSEKDGKIHDIAPELDDAKLQQIVNNHVDPKITFLFRQFDMDQDGKVIKLGAIIIRESGKPPHKITKPYHKKLRPGQCFVREGTSTREANEDDLEGMYAHRLTYPPPRILPLRLTDFRDRQDELNQIEQALRSFSTVGIFGMAGVGKTALTTHVAWLQRYYFPDGCSYHRVGRATPQALVSDIAERFGDKTVRAMPDYQQQLRVFRNLVGSKQALLFLDDVESAAQVRDILDTATSCAVLITSRHHLALALDVVISLEALSREDAVNLFCSRCRPHQLDEKAVPVAADICAALGDLPLAIDLAAKLVATGRVSRLDKLLGRLKKAALQVLQLEDQSVRASFNVSYDALKPEDQQLFASLGVFAGDSFSIEAVAAASGQQDVEYRLGDLTALSLVKRVYVETSDERFGLHPLLNEFASEKLYSRPDAREILRRVAEYFLRYAQEHTDNYDSLELERENILGAMDWCYENEEWSMVLAYEDALVKDGLRGFLSIRGYWDEQEFCLNQALEASHKLNDQKSEAESIHTLGITFMHRGDHKRAQEHYQRGLEIWKLLDDQRGIAATLHEMGRIAGRRGQYDEGREYFQRSQRIKELVGDQRGVAATLECLGGIATEQGRYEEAQLYYQRALDIGKQQDDRLQVTVVLHDMGDLAVRQGRYEEALNLYERSLSIAQELGSKKWIADNLHEMGLICAIQGHCEEAQCYYQQSLEIAEELRDQPSIAATLHCLGMLAADQGRYKEAQSYHERALEIDRAQGNQSGIAVSLHSMGYIAVQEGQYEQAKDLYQRSLQIREQLGEQSGIAETLHEMGRVAREEQHYAEALQYYKASLEISQELGDQHGIAATLQTIGAVYADQQNYTQAREYFERSLSLAEKLDARYWIALNKASLGHLAKVEGHGDTAKRLLEESLVIFKDIGSPEVNWVQVLLADVSKEGTIEEDKESLSALS